MIDTTISVFSREEGFIIIYFLGHNMPKLEKEQSIVILSH